MHRPVVRLQVYGICYLSSGKQRPDVNLTPPDRHTDTHTYTQCGWITLVFPTMSNTFMLVYRSWPFRYTGFAPTTSANYVHHYGCQGDGNSLGGHIEEIVHSCKNKTIYQ